MRPFLCLAGYWHSPHSHPWSVRVISSTIRASISDGSSGNNNTIASSSLFSYCLWYLELWIVRAFLLGWQSMIQKVNSKNSNEFWLKLKKFLQVISRKLIQNMMQNCSHICSNIMIVHILLFYEPP